MPGRKRQAAGATTLDDYAAKRSFAATPEPAPEDAEARAGPLLFVVQQHAARRLHFDFRLELDGALKSWAVPKGPVIAPGEPHLAVPTEDHPLAYGAFEGAIPKGQYGAGNVIVWDCGLYSPDEDGVYSFDDRNVAEQRVREALAAGKLSLFLLGTKLKGSYAMVRTKDRTWLLLKHRDAWGNGLAAPAEADRSALSMHTVVDAGILLAAERTTFDRLLPHGPAEELPSKLAPMLAGTAEGPFRNPDWCFEPKLDGYRVLAHVQRDAVQLRSRGGLDFAAAFPGIVDDLRRQLASPLLLDGEIVAFDNGRPSFNALQNRARLTAKVDIAAAERSTPCVYFCFDLLHALGMNLRKSPYIERRRYLAQCLLPTPRLQSMLAETDGEALYRAALGTGFEGMVAKRRTSVYRPGKRSDDWLKVKHVQTGEFVIGGYTAGKGSRSDRFGALVLGAWDDGALRPVGNVGSGFDDATLDVLRRRLQPLATRSMPFATTPEAEAAIVWTRPELVAEVQFAGWTEADLLRAPVFLRLREDIDPRSVRRPLPAAAARLGAAASTADIDAVLDGLSGNGATATLTVDGQRLRLTHLDKALWPRLGKRAAVTKRGLLRYLAAVSPYMLPHLEMRPLTVIRMPDGIDGEMFFQKHWDAQALPEFVDAVELEDDDGTLRRYVLCNNLPTLLWLGQMAALELHVPHARVVAAGQRQDRTIRIGEDAVFDRPDYIVFDLDPYIYSGKEAKGAEPEYNAPAFDRTREVAFHLRELLAAMSLRAFVKTTGKTGLHVFVPIERTISSEQAREACRLIGEHLRRLHPKDITMEWTVERRTSRIFYDHNMNGRGRTLNAAYSPRRVPGATVSMPLTWEALAEARPDQFDVMTAIDGLRGNGDAWRDIGGSRQDLMRIFDLSRG